MDNFGTHTNILSDHGIEQAQMIVSKLPYKPHPILKSRARSPKRIKPFEICVCDTCTLFEICESSGCECEAFKNFVEFGHWSAEDVAVFLREYQANDIIE